MEAAKKVVHLAQHIRLIREEYVVVSVRQSNDPRGWHAAFKCLRLCASGALIVCTGRRTRSVILEGLPGCVGHCKDGENWNPDIRVLLHACHDRLSNRWKLSRRRLRGGRRRQILLHLFQVAFKTRQGCGEKFLNQMSWILRALTGLQLLQLFL